MTWLKQISAWTSRPRLLKHRPFSSWTTHSSPVWYSDGSAHHTVNCKPCVSIKKHPLIRKFYSLGSFLSCSSAFSKVDRIPSVSSGFLPTIVKPFHTYIISCGNRWLLLTNAKIKKKTHQFTERTCPHQSRNDKFHGGGRGVSLGLLRCKLLRWNRLPSKSQPEALHLPSNHISVTLFIDTN